MASEVFRALVEDRENGLSEEQRNVAAVFALALAQDTVADFTWGDDYLRTLAEDLAIAVEQSRRQQGIYAPLLIAYKNEVARQGLTEQDVDHDVLAQVAIVGIVERVLGRADEEATALHSTADAIRSDAKLMKGPLHDSSIPPPKPGSVPPPASDT